jgi:hypothetical protein
MENKHTPGPWKAEENEGTWAVFDSEHFCIANEIGASDDFGKSDARLIAASPTMLEALLACEVTLKAFLPDAFATIAIVKEAIAKARG